MRQTPTQPLDPRLATFIREARGFCALVEHQALHEEPALRALLLRRLIALYGAVLDLPPRDALMGDDASDAAQYEMPIVVPVRRFRPISHDVRDSLASGLASRFGDANLYHDLRDPHDDPGEAVLTSLGHDIAGIHQDLLAGLSSLETDGLARGLWHFRTGFESSWHHRLRGALNALGALAGRTGAWPGGASRSRLNTARPSIWDGLATYSCAVITSLSRY